MEVLEKEIEQLLEKGIVPGLAMVRVGRLPEHVECMEKAEAFGKSVGVVIEKYIFPEKCDETDLMDVLEVINDDPQIHGILLLEPLPDDMSERRIRGMLNPAKDLEGLDWGSLAGTDVDSIRTLMETTVKAAKGQLR